MVEEADFENAKEVFGDIDGGGMDAPIMKGEDDYTRLAMTFADRAKAYEVHNFAFRLFSFYFSPPHDLQSSPHFGHFLKTFVKEATEGMKVEDFKAFSASVAAVSNERLKAQRDSQKGVKKATKASGAEK